jgi:predicted AAA+ superfamily ATPase
MQQLLSQGHTWDEMLYVNFEDDRLEEFKSSDFNLILECFAELSDERPMLFLDEIQNIDGWEKFARRLADSKYNVYITGSNAKMLSREVMTTLWWQIFVCRGLSVQFQRIPRHLWSDV